MIMMMITIVLIVLVMMTMISDRIELIENNLISICTNPVSPRIWGFSTFPTLLPHLKTIVMNPTVFIAPGPPSHSLFSNWSLFSDYLVDEVFWVSDDAHLAENRSFFNPGGKFCTVFCRFGFEFCKFASLRSPFPVSLSRTISLGQAFLLLKLLYWTRPQTRETLYIYQQVNKQKELEILY